MSPRSRTKVLQSAADEKTDFSKVQKLFNKLNKKKNRKLNSSEIEIAKTERLFRSLCR